MTLEQRLQNLADTIREQTTLAHEKAGDLWMMVVVLEASEAHQLPQEVPYIPDANPAFLIVQPPICDRGTSDSE